MNEYVILVWSGPWSDIVFDINGIKAYLLSYKHLKFALNETRQLRYIA